MLNLLLVLLITGGLALFALQNLTPIPLVILGQPTLSLPLAVWILVAIAAGIATSLLIAGLYKASNSVASRRAVPRRSAARKSNFVGRFSNPSRPSEPGRSYAPPSAAPDRRPSMADDDWETPSRSSEDWDDWEEEEAPRDRPPARAAAPQEPRPHRVPTPDPPLYDADFRTVDSAVPYDAQDVPFEPAPDSYRSPYEDRVNDEAEGSFYDSAKSPQPNHSGPAAGRLDLDDDDEDDEPEEWEDWEGYEESSSSSTRAEEGAAPYAGRTDFEVKQEPKTARRSGTVYSYSYREPTDDDGDDNKQESVYRSSQPLITPPPAEDPAIPSKPATPQDRSSNDDDWDLDDGFDERAPRR